MLPLKQMSRKSIVLISSLVWFVPSCFLLFQLDTKGMSGLTRSVLLLPLLYGWTMAAYLRVLFQQHWFLNVSGILVSIALPLGFVLLMLRLPAWRKVILIGGLVLFCMLAVAAHLL